jgi:nitronate monooxygenase
MAKHEWTRNALTERLGLKWPIFQAPMGNIASPALAAGVANAGGLGGMGLLMAKPGTLRERILSFRQMSDGRLNINFVLFDPAPDHEERTARMREALLPYYARFGLGAPPEIPPLDGQVTPHDLESVLEQRPDVVSFHLGLPPDDIMDALRGAGIFVISSATTVDEARELERRGADAVIAQGLEAGGHRGSFIPGAADAQAGLISLLPQVVDAVSVPVIAAGGIADGRGIAAALTLGASAVQLGTAFLTCPEAQLPNNYLRALARAGHYQTTVTDRASGKPSRVLKNEMEALVQDLADRPAPFPVQLILTQPLWDADPAMQTVWVGQSAALGRVMAAGQLVETLAAETSDVLARFT